MAKKADTTKKRKMPGNESDIFTALLGLTILVLGGTIGYVMWSSMEIYGKAILFF